jgi:hypothetical protein
MAKYEITDRQVSTFLECPYDHRTKLLNMFTSVSWPTFFIRRPPGRREPRDHRSRRVLYDEYRRDICRYKRHYPEAKQAVIASKRIRTGLAESI